MPATYLPQDPPTAPGFPELAGRLEGGGYDGIWVGEVNGADAVTSAALAATGTRRARIGVLLNTFTRAPATLAMTASTLSYVAPGRLDIVLGVASPMLVEGWNGIPFQRPYNRLRDVFRFLRAALAGARVDQEFSTFASHGFSLPSPPERPPCLLIAASGPRALELAADEADGVVLNWVTPHDLDRLQPLPSDRGRVCLVVYVCPTPDRSGMDDVMRPLLADYLQVPAYAALQRRLGRGSALEPLWQAWAAGNRSAARSALPASMLDELVVWGDPTACRDRLDEIEHSTGARAVAVFCLPPGCRLTDAAFAHAATGSLGADLSPVAQPVRRDEGR